MPLFLVVEYGNQACDKSLIELLDGAILLYSYGAHKQLQKMSNVLTETVDCYITALDDATDKLNKCPADVCVYEFTGFILPFDINWAMEQTCFMFIISNL